jgi:hypothetical protein
MPHALGLWLLVTAAAELASADGVVEKVRYRRQAGKQTASECTFTVQRSEQGWSIRSVTQAGKSQMSVSAQYDVMDRLTSATATLSSRDRTTTCKVEVVGGKVRVHREGKASKEFGVPPGVIVTSAPDWTDVFLLCRRYDRRRSGKQVFAGLWIHPEKEPLRLTFTIERKGADAIEHGGRKRQLDKFEIRLRNNDGYVAWADGSGRMIQLQPLKPGAGYVLVQDTGDK